MSSKKLIHLGFEIPRGDAVAIPLKHLAATGQTQESGKTTTLEALISRAKVTALAFVTKRGEGGFSGGHRIPPFFREGATGGRPYWEFVESIVASTMGQKMKFERAWIVKAARGAETLAMVRGNVAALMAKSKRSMDQDIFMLLGEYLDIVLPQIRRMPATDNLTLLKGGLNVMDVTDFTEEMQMLIVGSCVNWIHKHEKGVVTVMPEAWKFIPEGRMTPVKPIVERLVREGAALGNFVWMDAQDIAGVWKLMLRAVTVWLLGVQREHNELKRTLANIPNSVKKPKLADVARLEIGQFFACFKSETIKTYVQPIWLDEATAKAIAMGEKTVDEVARPKRPHPIPETPKPKGDQNMSAAIEEQLRQQTDLLRKFMEGGFKAQAAVDRAIPSPATTMPAVEMPADEDGLYQRFKARLLAESPAILRILVDMPEIQIQDVRRVITVKNTEPNGIFALMIRDGFFDSGATTKDALGELRRRGKECGPNVGSALCKDFANDGFLTFEKNGRYKAMGVMKKFIKD